MLQRVNQAVITAAPHHGMELFQEVSESIGEDTEGPVRDIRQLYNDVFLPRMRQFLQHKERPSEEPKKKGGATKVTQLRDLAWLGHNDCSLQMLIGLVSQICPATQAATMHRIV